MSVVNLVCIIACLLCLPATSLAASDRQIAEIIYQASEPFSDIETANLDNLLERIGDSRVVLIGESSHGTAEFYDMRARITRELITRKGFNIVAMETEWPDAAMLDEYVRGSGQMGKVRYRPFGGFPAWLLGNQSVYNFVHWLKEHNRRYRYQRDAVGFYGLDLYNLYGSIDAVVNYLEDVDPAMAAMARWQYDCLMPWVDDPPLYSAYMEDKQHRGCENAVNAVLSDIHSQRHRYQQHGKERYFDVMQNARLVRNGEFYFRTRYQDVVNSWNLRDNNMLDSLLAIMRHRGPSARAVVWAHNTHIGDARATDMHAAGEINLGQRARETFGDKAYLVGFGTDHGTVMAASRWGGPPQTINVPPAHRDSYGYLFHQVKASNFILPLRYPLHPEVRNHLIKPRLQRGIGSTYTPDPDKEIKHHYAHASLPNQFDEYIWIDETRAVVPSQQ